MKKLSILLVGCLVSLSMLAETQATCSKPNVTLKRVAYNSVTITWTGTNISYIVEYGTQDVGLDGGYIGRDIYKSTVHEANINGLNPNVKYEVRVIGICSDGSESKSGIVPFTTPAKPVCKAPYNVTVSNITGTSATIRWNPGDAGQNRWRIKWWKAGSGESGVLTREVEENPYVITGLNTSTDYYVSVCAICYDDASGESQESAYADNTPFRTTATPAPSYITQVEHNVGRQADRYTCIATSPVVLKSSISSHFVGFYEIMPNGSIEELKVITDMHAADKTYSLYPSVGKHTYIVAVSNEVINSPARQMPEAVRKMDPSGWPTKVNYYNVMQYDIYHVDVNYYTNIITLDLQADLLTNKATFNAYTMAGQPDPNNPGKTFCGLDFKYTFVRGTSPTTSGAKVIAGDASKVDDEIELSVGHHYYILAMLRRESNDITWCDRFSINVIAPDCNSKLVYKKWDDFMFVDNGVNGGNGTFVSYQWYKDGYPIEGATDQWYRTSLPQFEGDRPSGEYYVRIMDKDGNEIFTCPKAFDDLRWSSFQQPYTAPARKQIINGQLTIERDGHYYNAQGQRVQ